MAREEKCWLPDGERRRLESLGLFVYADGRSRIGSFYSSYGKFSSLYDSKVSQNKAQTTWKNAQYIFIDATEDECDLDKAKEGCLAFVKADNNTHLFFQLKDNSYAIYVYDDADDGDGYKGSYQKCAFDGVIDYIKKILDSERKDNRESKELLKEEYKRYIRNCTESSGSDSNYSSFDRIDECIKLLDGCEINSLWDVRDGDTARNLLEALSFKGKDPESLNTAQKKFAEINSFNGGGHDQYLRALTVYGLFLSAKAMFNKKQNGRPLLNYEGPVGMQKIFFGTPGTGKSHKIDFDLFVDENNKPAGKGLKNSNLKECLVWRTTFHPDYDYAQFVGSYKPAMMKDDSGKVVLSNGAPVVGYNFIHQVFANAYVAAWREYLVAEKTEDVMPVYLVIEEINRGNCAQIFGDIFQLLDRKNGWSEYPIDVDNDFASYVRDEIKKLGKLAEYRQAICDCMEDATETSALSDDVFCKIALPPNFNILATMNTSDQSLFPMDSAFKRRFDWEYVPIKYEKDAECGDKWNADQFTIELKSGKTVNWLKFLQRINADIYSITDSEDKQMGEFFIKPKGDDNVIKFEDFRSKVLFYLWDSVYKDEDGRKSFFAPDGKKISFQTLFNEKSCAEKIDAMLQYLDGDDEKFRDCPKILD